ncbi:MAG: GAF domain-containing protein, partial [Desulfatitalea sp.]|nr:PocR ligand-binding domain-containing protein [Desulfatitalea sp.]NNK01506.1 GAF domain-containing protein [Desulfatitalea sp.]
MNRNASNAEAGNLSALNWISLLDFLPLADLQHLQDRLARIGNVKIVIADVDGNPLTMPSNDLPICRQVKQSAKGLDDCLVNLRTLSMKARRAQIPFVEQCEGVGVLKAAVPIVVQKRHLANWWICQYCPELSNSAQILTYAQMIRLDGDKLLRCINHLPKANRQDFEKVLAWIENIAHETTRLAFRNLLLTQDLSKLSRIEDELAAYKYKFENQVQARTDDLVQTNKRLQLEVLEREMAEEQIHRKSKLLDAINQVLHQIVTDRNSEQALAGTCLQAAKALTDSPFGFMVENQEGCWRVVSVADQAVVQQEEHVPVAEKFEINGLWRQLVQTGESQILQANENTPPWGPLPRGYPKIKTLLAVPLPSHTGVSGFIA